ncbi:hypothetical protein B0J11DRAFT_504485 [Dendryphion nanum]|uniref:Uncharacterized protein n=1 Tax=Dendryphion nanum TaxID=256645 RepID=A0A9P9ISF3_9PLEO|nr:hypothetical protein B0J11DRAFT_504485 [Dendryphion nanum]
MCNWCSYYGQKHPNCPDDVELPSRPVDYNTPSSSRVSIPPVRTSTNSGRNSQRSTGSSVLTNISTSTGISLQLVASVQSLVTKLNRDLTDSRSDTNDLENWNLIAQVVGHWDRSQWTEEVNGAYEQYKASAHMLGNYHRDFLACGRSSIHTRADAVGHAYNWAEAAVTCAQQRIAFMQKYGYAYSSPDSVRTHIIEIQNVIASAQNAITEIRRNKAYYQVVASSAISILFLHY